MNTQRTGTIKESKTTLFRWAGVSAVAAELCFVIVGMFHPVTTATWINVHIAAVVMGFLGLYGMARLSGRQAEKAGWLALVGFVLFSL